MSSSNPSFYVLSDDEDSSEELFYFLNHHFSLFLNNSHFHYISDTETESESDDDLPDLIEDEFLIEPFQQNQNQRYKSVITEDVYDNLKKQFIKYKDLSELEKKENIECSISLEKFNDEDNIIKLNCGHFFHKEPILYWLYMQKNKCPICRYEYPFVEKRIE